MTDDELYRQYLAGERAAFDELILRYSDMLTAYVNAFLHNAQDAEDVMLDSFAAIVLNKPEIAEGRFRAYLFKTARNKANRLWRVRFRRQEFSLDEQEAETILSPAAWPRPSSTDTWTASGTSRPDGRRLQKSRQLRSSECTHHPTRSLIFLLQGHGKRSIIN